LVFIFYQVGFENIQETNSALYSLRSGLPNEVSLGIPFHLKKKVRGGCALLEGDMQKPYAPNPLSGFFLQKSPMNFIPVKVSTLATLYKRQWRRLGCR
jgi:hypothetical protein